MRTDANRRWLGVALLLVVVIGGLWYIWPADSGRASHSRDRTPTMAHAVQGGPAAEREAVQRTNPSNKISWRLQSEDGKPVAGASVSVDGVLHSCNDEGAGFLETTAATVPARASADGFVAWAGTLTAGAPNVIILVRGGIVRALVLDDDGAPVANAELWLARQWTDGSAYDLDPAVTKAVSDERGAAVFAALPPAKYFVHARHDVLVHSHDRYPDTAKAVTVATAGNEITIKMTMAYALGVEIAGGEIFYDSFRGHDVGYKTPQNPDGSWGCTRVRKKLEGRFPKAKFHVTARKAPRADRPYSDSYFVTMWMVGRVAWQGEIKPVPVPLFAEPMRIDEGSIPQSDDFGSVIVNVKDLGGLPVEGLLFALELPFAQWERTRPQVKHLKLRAGEMVSLPTGTYDLICQGHVESKVPGMNRKGVEVTKGSATEIVIESPVRWSRCRLLPDPGDSAQSMSGGGLVIENKILGLKVSTLLDSATQPSDFWLPEGITTVRIDAYSNLPGMVWRGILEDVMAGGGTLAAPQLMRPKMQLVAR